MPDKKPSPVVQSIVKAESGFQMALVLPVAVFVGWAIGTGLDHWLHQTWISIAGLLVGAVAGFVQIVRMATRNMND